MDALGHNRFACATTSCILVVNVEYRKVINGVSTWYIETGSKNPRGERTYGLPRDTSELRKRQFKASKTQVLKCMENLKGRKLAVRPSDKRKIALIKQVDC